MQQVLQGKTKCFIVESVSWKTLESKIDKVLESKYAELLKQASENESEDEDDDMLVMNLRNPSLWKGVLKFCKMDKNITKVQYENIALKNQNVFYKHVLTRWTA